MLERIRAKQNEKGFTLVELMIVVAIIGILAAIAIPQFAQYRIRGFNTSALSDMRNLTTAQEAFFSDWQAYAVTFAKEDSTTELGGADLVTAGVQLDGPTANLSVIAQVIQGVHRELPVAAGNGVRMIGSVDLFAVSYAAISNHRQGNTVYGSDSDSSALFRNQEALIPGALDNVFVAVLPAPVVQEIDFTVENDFFAM